MLRDLKITQAKILLFNYKSRKPGLGVDEYLTHERKRKRRVEDHRTYSYYYISEDTVLKEWFSNIHYQIRNEFLLQIILERKNYVSS